MGETSGIDSADARAVVDLLRVLKGTLRSAGFPVRTLFPNVLETRGIGDFWSRRWNVGYSQMMERLIGRPVEALAGANAGVMAIFVASGVLHELAITLPVCSGFGLPTLYFTLHGLLALLEKQWGRSFGRTPALLAVVLPLGLLFPTDFQNEVIARCLGVFDFMKNMTPEARKNLLFQFRDTLRAVRSYLDDHGAAKIPAFADLPVWYDQIGKPVGWTSAAERDAWFADLGKSLAGISMMAYERNTAARIESGVEWELANFKVEVRIGLEVSVGPGKTWKTFDELVSMIKAQENAKPTRRVDIHDLIQFHDAARSKAD